MRPDRFIPKSRAVERMDALTDLARGKDILHIGMGGFISDQQMTSNFIETELATSLHVRLAQVASGLTGLDVNPVMIEAMRSSIPGDYIVADITAPGLPNRLQRRFDIVLFPEVIEHLDCFHIALANIRGLLATDGVMIITTINAYCLDKIIKLVFRYEAVHEEHTSYFSYRTMKRLLDMNGFAIEDFAFTFENRKKLAGSIERFPYYAMLGAIIPFPQFAEGLLFVARPCAPARSPA